MALPSSGALSFGSIAGEMGISAANALSTLSSYAGNSSGYVPGGLTSSPYAMGEFFGFSFQSLTYSPAPWFNNDPCGSSLGLYQGSNGLYYEYAGGPTYTGYGYQYSYDNGEWWSGNQYQWNLYYFGGGNAYYQYTVGSGCASFGFN